MKTTRFQSADIQCELCAREVGVAFRSGPFSPTYLRFYTPNSLVLETDTYPLAILRKASCFYCGMKSLFIQGFITYAHTQLLPEEMRERKPFKPRESKEKTPS